MFAKRLRELRLSKGLDQKDIAKAIDVLDATVSMWETGKRVPYYDLLIKLANYFDVSVDYLLGNDYAIKKYENKLTEKEIFKHILINNNYIKKNESISDDEIDKIIKFIINNKDIIRNN